MDDEKVERLLESYADQLPSETLNEAIRPELRARLSEFAGRNQDEKKRGLMFWLVAGGGAAAACIGLILTLRSGPVPDISAFTITPATERGTKSEFELGLSLSRHGIVRVILIDDRHEPWVMPFEESAAETSRYHLHVEDSRSLWINANPNPEHPQSRAIFVMVLVSTGSTPEPNQLLQILPDPIVPEAEGRQALRAALEKLADKLKARFECEVRFGPVPEA